MEEKKTPVESGAEQQPQVKLVDKEPVVAAFEKMPAAIPTPIQKKSPLMISIAVVLVVIALGAVWMRLEREDRVSTSFFSSIIASQEAGATVATVNGTELLGKDLELSIEQLEQAAIAQGRNPADEKIKTDIRELAVDMLVNTTLLQQAAETEGIAITDEQVQERMTQLEIESGGAEVLAARMEEFGIDRDTFARDVRTELTIVTLLDTVFAVSDLSVTEEEVAAVYEQAGGASPDAPSLAEVRPQIEAQIVQSKEQSVVDAYLEELRAAADIKIVS